MQPEQNQNYWQPSADAQIDQPAPVAAEPEAASSVPSVDSDTVISWQASEYVHHEKGGSWFLALLGIAALLLLLDFFLIRSWTFGALILAMTLAVMVIARRPPRMVNYTLSPEGIQIDQKYFGLHDFRAFGVVQENAFYSVRLIPNKRFMPMVSVFFPTEHGEGIVDILGSSLPMEHVELDPIDKLVEKIRF